jgi:tetratricopeptide (TPR) repeat protein
LAPETTTDDLIRRLSVLDSDELAPFSQMALREAGQELVEAIADADDEGVTEWLAQVGKMLRGQRALSRLDAVLGGTPEEWRDLLDAEDADERSVIVAARLMVWLRESAPSQAEPPSLERLLALGWTPPGCSEFRTTFYRAYCLSLHDGVRRAIKELEPVLLAARLEPLQWYEWLGLEAGLPPLQMTEARKPVFGVRTIAAVAAALVAAIWWLVAGPHRDHTPRTGSTPSHGAGAAISATPEAPSGNANGATGPTGATSDASIAGATPGATPPTPPPDPISHARMLLAKAKKAVEEANTAGADSDASNAQELLEALLPAHDPEIGEALKELAQHWETRERWPEAARVLQKAVQAYEGTPAENAGPQLEAVNRWAGALRKTGRLTEAEKLYRTLLQAYEGTGPALEVDAATVAHNLANALVDSGRFADARGYYERALTLLADHWPTEDEAQRLAGIMGQNYQHCLVALGIPDDEALAHTRKLLKLPPTARGR